jgi:hypothetical protein
MLESIGFLRSYISGYRAPEAEFVMTKLISSQTKHYLKVHVTADTRLRTHERTKGVGLRNQEPTVNWALPWVLVAIKSICLPCSRLKRPRLTIPSMHTSHLMIFALVASIADSMSLAAKHHCSAPKQGAPCDPSVNQPCCTSNTDLATCVDSDTWYIDNCICPCTTNEFGVGECSEW